MILRYQSITPLSPRVVDRLLSIAGLQRLDKHGFGSRGGYHADRGGRGSHRGDAWDAGLGRSRSDLVLVGACPLARRRVEGKKGPPSFLPSLPLPLFHPSAPPLAQSPSAAP